MDPIRYREFTSTRPFGVELEVSEKVDRVLMGHVIQEVDPSRQVIVSGWTMTGVAHGVAADCWSVKTDSTCATVQGNYGNEVASYKASGSNDIKMMGNVAEALLKKGCEVNRRCGVHVHADISDWDANQVGVMLAYWCKIENIIAQMLPAHRRNNQYAMMMRRKHTKVDYSKTWTGTDLYKAMEPKNLEIHHNMEKRVAINLIGYTTGLQNPNHGRRTAENRLLEGTLDREDIENWTRMYVHFVEECKGKPMPDLQGVDVQSALSILGLKGTNEFHLLGPELYQTKVWFLKRLLKYANDPEIFREAIVILNKLVEPLETYKEIVVNNAA